MTYRSNLLILYHIRIWHSFIWIRFLGPTCDRCLRRGYSSYLWGRFMSLSCSACVSIASPSLKMVRSATVDCHQLVLGRYSINVIVVYYSAALRLAYVQVWHIPRLPTIILQQLKFSAFLYFWANPVFYQPPEAQYTVFTSGFWDKGHISQCNREINFKLWNPTQ